MTVERASGAHPEEQAAILAFHFSHGDDHRRAWHYALVAADHARDASANPEAATQYRPRNRVRPASRRCRRSRSGGGLDLPRRRQ